MLDGRNWNLFRFARPEKQRWWFSISNIVFGCTRLEHFMLLSSPLLAFLYRRSFGSYIITECCLLCDQLDGCIDTLGALRENTSSNRSFAHLSNRLGGRKGDEGVLVWTKSHARRGIASSWMLFASYSLLCCTEKREFCINDYARCLLFLMGVKPNCLSMGFLIFLV